MSIVRLINPLVQAIGNFVGPHSARTLQEGGMQKLVAGIGKVSKLMLVAMLAYLVVILIGGRFAMDVLYGAEYADQPSLLIILSLAAAVAAIGMAPAKGISAMEMPQLNSLANFLGFVVVVSGAWFSFASYGVVGVACAILSGALACAVAKWYLFHRIARQQSSESTGD